DLDLGSVVRELRRLEKVDRDANDQMRLARLHGNECVDDRVELELVAARGHTPARQQCSREKENERRSTMHHGACFRWRQEASDPENVHGWPPRPPRNSIARAKTAGNALRPRPPCWKLQLQSP